MGSLVALALVAGTSGAANASTAGPADPLPPAVELAFESRTVSVDGVVSFDFSGALESGVPEAVAVDFARGVVTAGGVVESAPILIEPFAGASARACSGQNSITPQWYGNQVQLDSCMTNRVLGALNSGAGAAGIAAILSSAAAPIAAVAGVLAGVLVVMSGAVGICSADGNGFVLHQVWTGQSWCTGP